jgi:putative heme-binding domain-containing protein
MWVFRIICLLAVAGALVAQHGYNSADIENGGRLYLANCTVCHGPEGDQIPGVDLGHGKFRRATDDEDIEQIIVKGIPGTGMPSHDFTEQQAESIVAYLRSLATAGRGTLPGGNTARGKVIFEGKGECLKCHIVRGNGSRLGPDLTEIGLVRRTAQLEESLVDPNAEILPENRTIHVVTKSGEQITGRLLNVDTLSLLLLDSKEQLRHFLKSELSSYSLVKESPMPSYKGKLSNQELADVVSYLSSLKGVGGL